MHYEQEAEAAGMLSEDPDLVAAAVVKTILAVVLVEAVVVVAVLFRWRRRHARTA